MGVTGITSSQADCEAIAALFDNTCSGTSGADAITVSSHAGEDLSCAGQMMCPGTTDPSTLYTTGSPCTFTRKLCVTCKTKSDGSVVMRIQNNEMPNHCMQAINENPRTDVVVDFEVNWNEDVTGVVNYQETDADTEAKTSELLCDLQRTNASNMMSSTGY